MNLVEIDARMILERITDSFYALDTEWNFNYINEKAALMLLRSRDDLIGKNVWDEFPDAVELPFYEQYHKAVREQVVTNFEAYFPPLDAWFDVTAYPSNNGLSVYFQNVTVRRKEASEKQQHYKSLFEQNPDAVFSFDLDGNYLSVNTAMERLLGYTEEEFLQLSFIPIVAQDDLEKTTEFYEKAAKGVTQNYETRAVHKDGHIVHLNVTNMPIIVDGIVIGVYGIAKDITDQKMTEQRLVKSEKLTAVGQLAASIAHEIRNPLTALKGFLQLMKASTDHIETSYLEVMSKEIERIELITGELLLLAKPQAHHFAFENIGDIFEDVKTLLSSQALMNKVEIIVQSEDLPLLYCVGNQLKQVFINLIKNAIESMPDGGMISVTLSKRENQTLHIKITDQGCGIPEEFLTNIGTPFYTTKQKGTGLGMMTSLKIIEAHNGTMNISSKVGKGTTVLIEIPLDHE